MALHVIFIDSQGTQLSDVTSNFTSVTIPQNAFIMRIADDAKSYSNSTLTKLFEIDNTFYSKVLEYTTKGDYPFIDISVSEFGGFTAIFNQLSAQFVGNNPPSNIYDFTGYGGSSGGNIDFSTIVTALNSIASALSALSSLSNLSNLADLANIITAISNKDNQSGIIEELRFIFTQNVGNTSSRKINNVDNMSVLKGFVSAGSLSSSSRLNRTSFFYLFRSLCTMFSGGGFDYNGDTWFNPDNRLLKNIDSKLQNIETKLEQNLPFETNVYVNPLIETNCEIPFEVKCLNRDQFKD